MTISTTIKSIQDIMRQDAGVDGDALMEFVDNELFLALKELAFQVDVDPRGLIVGEVFADTYNYMKMAAQTTGTALKTAVLGS
jgi:hypothetical protein